VVVASTATAGEDYQTLSGTVTIPAGANSATIPVLVIDDDIVEATETVIVQLTGAGGAAVVDESNDTATVHIIDDDTATVSISNEPTVTEGGALAFEVTISNPVDVAVTADRTTADGSATTADNDYTALPSESVTLFAAGSTTALTIPVQTTEDDQVELDERLNLILSNLAAGGRAVTFSGGGATLSSTGTILNDDSAVISISDPEVIEGGVLEFVVTISNPVDVTVTADRRTWRCSRRVRAFR
jgi:hypothetical protein